MIVTTSSRGWRNIGGFGRRVQINRRKRIYIDGHFKISDWSQLSRQARVFSEKSVGRRHDATVAEQRASVIDGDS